MRRTWAALAASTAVAGVVWITACASVPADARIGIDAPSAAVDQFGPVGDFLTWRCGSLDCHGTVGRNFRVWGCDGMRLQPGDIPECIKRLNGRPTTADEYQETYRSLVALEPAVMSFVVDDGAKHPELLTFVRKSRGEESHKGGTIVNPGDPQDVCITSWLEGNTDSTACNMAVSDYPMIPNFNTLDASTE
jgi:hypothetical protein